LLKRPNSIPANPSDLDHADCACFAIDRRNAGAETVENSPGIDAARAWLALIRIRDIMEYPSQSVFKAASEHLDANTWFHVAFARDQTRFFAVCTPPGDSTGDNAATIAFAYDALLIPPGVLPVRRASDANSVHAPISSDATASGLAPGRKAPCC
jgi:hypothetical protein